MPHPAFQARVVGAQAWDPASDNVDVEVTLENGQRFGATFFTLENIRRLFAKNRQTGECAGGMYLWASSMILVNELTLNVINSAVVDLLESGEFHSAFEKL